MRHDCVECESCAFWDGDENTVCEMCFHENRWKSPDEDEWFNAEDDVIFSEEDEQFLENDDGDDEEERSECSASSEDQDCGL